MDVVIGRRQLRWAVVVLAAVLAAGLAAGLRPARAEQAPPSSDPKVIWQVATRAPEVAITFDDGPDPTYTPQILNTLTTHKAVGTFFVLGQQAEEFPEMVKAEAAQGSQVCNHGYSHLMLRGRSADAVAAQAEKTAAILKGIGVPACNLFRFPYFASDAVARSTIAGAGYQMIGANLDTEDWRGYQSGFMANRVLSQVKPGDIILFHDAGGDRRQTVSALGLVLDGLREKDLKAVTVGQLLASVAAHPPSSTSRGA